MVLFQYIKILIKIKLNKHQGFNMTITRQLYPKVDEKLRNKGYKIINLAFCEIIKLGE